MRAGASFRFSKIKTIKHSQIHKKMQEEKFLCPITREPMKEPVFTCDGHTYEKSAIANWLINHNTSPITGLVLANKNLVPNWALKQEQHGQTMPQNEYVESTPMNIEEKKIEISYHGKIRKIVASGTPDPTSVVLVLDVSGSMNESACADNKSNDSSRFTRLELVKHAALTVIDMLDKDDYLAIITFSQTAKILMNWTKMTGETEKGRDFGAVFASDGREIARKCISSLRTEGSTNLGDGILAAYSLPKIPNYTKNIMVLTDGVPTCDPMRGYGSLLNGQDVYATQMDIFGFGHEVKTELLDQISKIGQGMFYYIADGSMVGTVFIHCLAILKQTIYTYVIIETTDHTQTCLTNLCKDIPFFFQSDFPIQKIYFRNGETQDVTEQLSDCPLQHPLPLDFLDVFEEALSMAKLGSFDKGYELMKNYSFKLNELYPIKNDIFHVSFDKGQIGKGFENYLANFIGGAIGGPMFELERSVISP